MEIILFLLPLLTALGLFFIKGLDILFCGKFLLIMWGASAIAYYTMKRHRKLATEYVSSYGTLARHHDKWTEIKKGKRSVPRTDANGKTTYKTEEFTTYIDHPESWELLTNSGTLISISSDYFDFIYRTWQVRSRSTSTTGDNIVGGVRYSQEIDFDDVLDDFRGIDSFTSPLKWKYITITQKHRYINRVKASNSIYNFRKVTEKEANTLGLFDYPSVSYEQDAILGREVDGGEQHTYKLFNAIYEPQNNIHLFVLCFDSDKGIEIAEDQRAYWHGGNRNEFVICLGLKHDEVKWSHAFSWMDDPSLCYRTVEYFRQNPKLDFNAFIEWLRSNLDLWQPKDFDDFKYIDVPLSTSQTTSLFATVGLSCFAFLIGAPDNNNTNGNYGKSIPPETEILANHTPPDSVTETKNKPVAIEAIANERSLKYADIYTKKPDASNDSIICARVLKEIEQNLLAKGFKIQSSKDVEYELKGGEREVHLAKKYEQRDRENKITCSILLEYWGITAVFDREYAVNSIVEDALKAGFTKSSNDLGGYVPTYMTNNGERKRDEGSCRISIDDKNPRKLILAFFNPL